MSPFAGLLLAALLLGALCLRLYRSRESAPTSLLLFSRAETAAALRRRLGAPVECSWAPSGTPWDLLADRLHSGNFDTLLAETLPDDPDDLVALLFAARRSGAALLVPYEFPENEWARMEKLENVPLARVLLREPSPLWLAGKRLSDLLLGLLLLAPAMAVAGLIGLAMKRHSPGPLFYRQRRLGRNGVPFDMLKLRTMPVDAEAETGPVWAGEDDPRATPFGRIIRRLGLDELPQILHVFSGRMSLVGPRPERDFFARRIPALRGRRLLVPPGLTGAAQIRLPKEVPIAEKLEHDVWYVESGGIRLDVEILWKTSVKLLARIQELIGERYATRCKSEIVN